MTTKVILPIIVLAQFCCTSLWFAGNGVMTDLITTFGLAESALGHLTSAVQFGFIAGTLVFAVLMITDRYSPSKVFLVSALMGALFNGFVMWGGNGLTSLLVWRALTGFCLAGIYPVGMKIAADHFDKGLGKSLGFLVGALVLGTAFPHAFQGFSGYVPWRMVLVVTSSLAVTGGLLMVTLVPDGPYRSAGKSLDLSAFFGVFRNKEFRSAAFGYFGHMWELYTFWTFVPVMLAAYSVRMLEPGGGLNISLLSFLIIGIGGLACVAGGYLSERVGVKRTATVALLLSGCCCLLSPWLLMAESKALFLAFLFAWGAVVIADSPMFSTLVARSAPPEIKGTALTIVNCIGFAITIISIQLVGGLREVIGDQYVYLVLAVGPLLGWLAGLTKT